MIISKTRNAEKQIESLYGDDADGDSRAKLLWRTPPVQKHWFLDYYPQEGESACASAYWNITVMGGDWISVKEVLSAQEYANRFGIAVDKTSLNEWTIEEFRLVKAIDSDLTDIVKAIDPNLIDKNQKPKRNIKQLINKNALVIECDSIVILPSEKTIHESGYRLMEIVALEGSGYLAKPICRIVGSDHDAVEFKDGRGTFAAPPPDSNWVHLPLWHHDILATSGLVHSWSTHGKIRIHHASPTIEIVQDFHEDEV